MPQPRQTRCPDCVELDRRGFLGTMGTAIALGALSPVVRAAEPLATTAAAPAKPAEALVQELCASLSSEQRGTLIYPWNHGADKEGLPTRLRMVNSPHFNRRIGDNYTKPQQELCQQILRSICSGEEGYQRISRNGTFDGSHSFDGLGAVLFGEPTSGQPYSFVFTGHHLTIRCDGNSEPGAAFGGPMYYGHSPHGYSPNNAFYYQTKSVLSVFDALDAAQRERAVVAGHMPGEQYASVKFRPQGETRPGIAMRDLSSDQQALVEQVMRDILSPYRKEDADEVMEIVQANGGREAIQLAFYKDARPNDQQPWHFWRLEGPGFVWNYRVLPHVHTFVNISKQA